MSEQGFPVNSRFRITSSPEILPGKCVVCGAVDRPVVDFSTTVPLYGAILMCFSCLSEAAFGIGMVPESELKSAQENLARTLNEQLQSLNMIGVPRERYDDIVVAVSGLSDVILFGDSGYSSLVAEPYGESQPPLFDADAAYIVDAEGFAQGDAGNPEQNDNTAVSEGPSGVSVSGSDGSSTIDF